MEKWRGKEAVQAYIGDDGDKGRRNEVTRERDQHYDNQIKKGDRRGIDPQSKADISQQGQNYGAEQTLRGGAPESVDVPLIALEHC
jgi:hypothetical protein